MFNKLLSAPLLACVLAFPAMAGYAQSYTIFGNATPQNPVISDPNASTLGVKFSSTQAGTISGIRFYRGATNSSGYTVKLFKSGGSLIASAKASHDTCTTPCWEQVNFSSPPSIAANTTYIAAYYTSNGSYAGDHNGLMNAVTNGPLTALASSSSGGNGVYTYSTGFPNQSYLNSNYYVDVSFSAPGGAACPKGTSYPDGCSAAPAGTPQVPNLFSAPFAPHTSAYAVRPPWNVAGVDYHVGCSAPTCAGGLSTGQPLKDPTVAGALPSGVTYDSVNKIVNITGSNVTLQGFDFCTPGISLQVADGATGTTITQNKFCAASSAVWHNSSNIIFVNPNGGNSDITFTQNEIDGKSPTHSGSGFSIEAAFKTYGSGKAVVEYNYVHDMDNKIWRLEGPQCSGCFVYSYNLSENVGMYSGTSGDHSEVVFNGYSGTIVNRVMSFNTEIVANPWQGPSAGTTTLITSIYSIGNLQGVSLTINGDQITNNTLINEGTTPGSATLAGELSQYGCNGTDICRGNTWANNYVDVTGGYYPWYPFYGDGVNPSAIAADGHPYFTTDVTGNINLVSGQICSPTVQYYDNNFVNHPGGSGTCN